MSKNCCHGNIKVKKLAVTDDIKLFPDKFRRSSEVSGSESPRVESAPPPSPPSLILDSVNKT